MSKLPYPAHILQPNEACQRPRHIICVDTESDLQHSRSDRIVHTFKLGSATYFEPPGDHRPVEPDHLDFTDLNTFWDWVEAHAESKTKTYLFSHNLDYDLATLDAFHRLPQRGWRLRYLVTQPRARIYTFGKPTEGYEEHLESGGKWGYYKGRKWEKTLACLDSMNIFPGSIGAWGLMLGIPKLLMPEPNADSLEWQEYNRRDTAILVAMVTEHLKFLNAHDLGNFKPTLPGQAFTAYRHRFMEDHIFTHKNTEAVALERAGYFGGRVEPFYLGKADMGTIYRLDVNSMYPHVMQENTYPTVLTWHGVETRLEALRYRMEQHCVMARVTLNLTAPVFPHRVDKRNVYPTGRFTTVLSTPELQYALDNNWISEILEISVYNCRPIFGSYVRYFYILKQQAEVKHDLLHRQMAKMYLNSLYGKFGQKGYKDTISGTCPDDIFEVTSGYDTSLQQFISRICVGGTITYQWQEGEGRQSFVAIAAHVTAYARMYLWWLMLTAGAENVLYVDTDCLFVTEAGYKRLLPYVDEHEIGSLKLEATDDHPEFRAPKDYSFNSEIVRKGIPAHATQIAPKRYEVTLWPSLTNLWQHHITDHYENFVISKRLNYKCDWGDLQTSGWIKPYCLE